MLTEIAASWTWIKRFEALTRCADTLDEVRDDVHDPARAQAARIPPVGRLKAALGELVDVSKSVDFRAAREGLVSWSERGSVTNLRALFDEATRALRSEARLLASRNSDEAKQVALLYQVAMLAERAPTLVLAETGIADDFGVSRDVAERWVTAAVDRKYFEVNEYLPESGRRLRITTRGLDALERIIEASAPAIATREKQQKFGILDAPNLLAADLDGTPGCMGACFIYLDLDNFKAINTRFTERVVDQAVLPQLHRILHGAAEFNGFAYAEGGDEFGVLLPNATEAMGVAFAHALLEKLRKELFAVGEEHLRITASIGLASTERFARGELPERANEAKARAKVGKDRVVVAGMSD